MKKKGFTLIELLAVIVILAVLALILTPIIQDLITNASEAAFRQTINGILSSAENYAASYALDNNGIELTYPVVFTCDGTSCKDENNNKLDFNGKVPITGTITIAEESIVADNLCDEKHCGSGSKEALIVSGNTPTEPCSYPIGTEWEFDYLDETNEDRIHTMNVPCKGYYKLEVWGAQGGSYSETYHGGYGGYSTGNILLEKTDTLYIVVGGKGTYLGANIPGSGGYNGGGSILATWSDGNERRSTGGGATHIALNNNLGELKNYVDNKDDILIVAGGGGGSVANAVMVGWGTSDGAGYGGSGGGTKGGSSVGSQNYYSVIEAGATQESGTGHGSFGQGGTMPIDGDKPGLFGGGGSGWYGGSEGWRGGAGGSGHLSSKLVNGEMYCYNCMDVEDAFTENVGEVSENPISEIAKKENGYAKVTYIGTRLSAGTKTVWKYKYTGTAQEFTAPKTGTYKVELWGAQGGSGTYTGGQGGYTSGEIDLTAGQKLYVYVGGMPSNASNQAGGWNGGGSTSPEDDGTGRAGGGATDIRIVPTSNASIWNEFNSLKSRIMVAGGGGGAACESNSWCSSGGPAGGLTGLIPQTMGSDASNHYGLGGTQTSGVSSIGSHNRDSGLSRESGFGYGGHSGSTDDSGAGGGGYYGGGGSGFASGGGGGSSFIAGYTGCDAVSESSTSDNIIHTGQSIHYSTMKFSNASMKSGNEEMPTHSGLSTMTGNIGSGYAKITFIK